jgi:6,7-dimethyl-8-ribityllumazine synthase
MASSTDADLDRAELDRLAALAGTTLLDEGAGTGLRVAIACSCFNGAITTRLLEGCLAGLADAGVDRTDVTVAWAPGAFELPLVARAFATSSAPPDVVVCLGAVIRGETGHYDVVANECARGVQDVALASGVPVIFGVLTCDTLGQAMERSDLDGANKGRDAAVAAIGMARLLEDRRFQ